MAYLKPRFMIGSIEADRKVSLCGQFCTQTNISFLCHSAHNYPFIKGGVPSSSNGNYFGQGPLTQLHYYVQWIIALSHSDA